MTFTLVCQPICYWHDYSQCNEENPVAHSLISQSPVHFVAFSLLYGYLVIFLITKLPKPANILLVGIVLGAHAHASVTWLPRLFKEILCVEANEIDLYLYYLTTIVVGSIIWFSVAFYKGKSEKQTRR
jgi:hypothetical protein